MSVLYSSYNTVITNTLNTSMHEMPPHRCSNKVMDDQIFYITFCEYEHPPDGCRMYATAGMEAATAHLFKQVTFHPQKGRVGLNRKQRFNVIECVLAE